MKQLTSYNRIAGFLNKLFDMLNERFFESELERPVITVQSTPKAYAHFCMRPDTWTNTDGKGFHEINIGAGTLNRPIENICASMVHEMVHYYCFVHGIKDTSNGNVYHNHRFRDQAQSRGLVISKHPTYGWTITEPGDELIEFVLENGLQEIQLSRNENYGISIAGGSGSRSGGITVVGGESGKKKSSHKMICPVCGLTVRATKLGIRLICKEDMAELVYVD